MYDLVFVTHIPCFYKINLYKRIADSRKIYVIFIGGNTTQLRGNDFCNFQKLGFDYIILNKEEYELRTKVVSLARLLHALKKIKYRKIIVGGWDLIEFWIVVLLSAKRKNCLALESSIFNSSIYGIKGLVKRLFLKNISILLASGSGHKKLAETLGYKGVVRITLGVGLINKPVFNVSEKKYSGKYLFVGRLEKEKNLEFLVEVFNLLPDLTLTIVGVGSEYEYLRSISNDNITYAGAVENSSLQKYFLKSDFLILPSSSEPWGLVVEESLYYQIPVIVSKTTGASELIVDSGFGVVIDPLNVNELRDILTGMKYSYHSILSKKTDFIEKKDKHQLRQYTSIS